MDCCVFSPAVEKRRRNPPCVINNNGLGSFWNFGFVRADPGRVMSLAFHPPTRLTRAVVLLTEKSFVSKRFRYEGFFWPVVGQSHSTPGWRGNGDKKSPYPDGLFFPPGGPCICMNQQQQCGGNAVVEGVLSYLFFELALWGNGHLFPHGDRCRSI